MAPLTTLRLSAALLAALWLVLPGRALAQAAPTGRLEGTVLADGTTPAMANVTVSGPGFYRMRVTDEGGQYRFEAVPPGVYVVRAFGAHADDAGFAEIQGVIVRQGGRTLQNLVLRAPPAE